MGKTENKVKAFAEELEALCKKYDVQAAEATVAMPKEASEKKEETPEKEVPSDTAWGEFKRDIGIVCDCYSIDKLTDTPYFVLADLIASFVASLAVVNTKDFDDWAED